MPGERIPGRAIFEITGADRFDFLQGLVTNQVPRDEGRLTYAALLTPQGKYIADFFLTVRGEAVLLDVAGALAPTLAQRLNMYKLRADVQIAPSALHASRGTGPAPQGALPDPRHEALGWRLYSEEEGGEPRTDWTALRVAHCIPETGIELTPETYILEAGFERLHGVDFKKGCYVGQEVTARMKHKTELRKGLARVRVEGAPEPGAEITTADGRPAGILHSRAGDRAIAYLRFDRAEGEMRAGEARITRL
ncbi:folate-binding protein YgfZ [Actibacterium sp. MT2.3-13A]|uniref:CAF17-like 4Fe-4S cluster assembly/insertion protein YgfZ n=1 Tax=Actibacterium sp. MT2.3-13A TaxID=2828332 RepID=UPI001BAA7D23|nr:folate-binding protein YgfZ [Actibacterium sp. MT2.3-13A]